MKEKEQFATAMKEKVNQLESELKDKEKELNKWIDEFARADKFNK